MGRSGLGSQALGTRCLNARRLAPVSQESRRGDLFVSLSHCSMKTRCISFFIFISLIRPYVAVSDEECPFSLSLSHTHIYIYTVYYMYGISTKVSLIAMLPHSCDRRH